MSHRNIVIGPPVSSGHNRRGIQMKSSYKSPNLFLSSLRFALHPPTDSSIPHRHRINPDIFPLTVNFLHSRSLDKCFLGLQHSILILKQGDYELFHSIQFTLPSLLSSLVQRDSFSSFEVFLTFLKWFTRSLDFAQILMKNSVLRSFLCQQLNSFEYSSFVYKIYANFIAADDCFFKDFISSGGFLEMVLKIDRFIQTINVNEYSIRILKAISLILPQIFISVDHIQPELIEIAGNSVFALIMNPRTYSFAISAMDESTNVQNVSVVRVFYDHRFFDRCYSLCHDENSFVRLHMFSILNHFTQLELCDLERFLFPAFQSFDLSFEFHGTDEIEKLMEISYNLIVKGREVAVSVIEGGIFRYLSGNTECFTWKLRELWCLNFAAVLKMGIIAPVFEFVNEFVRNGCEIFETVDYFSQRLILEGISVLKRFFERVEGCRFQCVFERLPEFEDFMKCLPDFVNSSCDCVRNLAEFLLQS
jgi:hypothetical protein